MEVVERRRNEPSLPNTVQFDGHTSQLQASFQEEKGFLAYFKEPQSGAKGLSDDSLFRIPHYHSSRKIITVFQVFLDVSLVVNVLPIVLQYSSIWMHRVVGESSSPQLGKQGGPRL